MERFTLPSAVASRSRRHVAGTVLACLSAVAIVGALLSHRWFVPSIERSGITGVDDPDSSYLQDGFGLLSYQPCWECSRVWNKPAVEQLHYMYGDASPSLAFPALGIVTFGCLVFAMGGLVLAVCM